MRFKITPEDGPDRFVEDRPKDVADWEAETGHNALQRSVRDWSVRDFWVMAYVADTRTSPHRPGFEAWKRTIDDVTLDTEDADEDPTTPAPSPAS